MIVRTMIREVARDAVWASALATALVSAYVWMTCRAQINEYMIIRSHDHRTLASHGTRESLGPSVGRPQHRLTAGKCFENYRIDSIMVARSVVGEPREESESQARKMQICIKTLTGKTVTLEVWDSDTIEKMKERATKKLGIQSVNHRLTRAGKCLEAENRTIREVGIRKCESRRSHPRDFRC